jgi:hypothetical protein
VKWTFDFPDVLKFIRQIVFEREDVIEAADPLDANCSSNIICNHLLDGKREASVCNRGMCLSNLFKFVGHLLACQAQKFLRDRFVVLQRKFVAGG